VLARSEQAVLVADRFMVYPNGLSFTLTLFNRKPIDGRFGGPPWELHAQHDVANLSDDFIRLGVLFSDGRSWTNLESRFPGPDDDPQGPLLLGRGGGGGGLSWEMSYWLWPLPPSGELSFVVSWPAQGIDEQFIALDADEFLSHVDSVEHIWPETT